MIIVQNGDIDRALKKLKNETGASGVMKALKDKEYFVKPGVKRRLAKKEGIKNWKKQQRKYNY